MKQEEAGAEANVARGNAKWRVGSQVSRSRRVSVGIPGPLTVAITMDRSGRLCSIVDRTVDVIEAIRDAPPSEPGAMSHRRSVRELMDDAQRRRYNPCGRYDLTFDPDRDEVGYRFESGEGVLVARREVTVHAGQIKKAHVVELPIAWMGSVS